jgi:glutamyl-tRNA synthetase
MRSTATWPPVRPTSNTAAGSLKNSRNNTCGEIPCAAPQPSGPAHYVGRLAPTPTGFLHVGHAATFWTAFRRAREAGGGVILRIEDLDRQRCRDEFAAAAEEDLRWLGIEWVGDPVRQSRRTENYLGAWRRLRDAGTIYPCARSRAEIAAQESGHSSAHAPHGEEPLFPVAWRGNPADARTCATPAGTNWRFRVPDGRRVVFHDGRAGRIEKTAGRDFGDFLVWNRDGVPAYELAVVVDDAQITEVVRGEDLLTSTARQILLHETLRQHPPHWFHCPLVRDESGRRLAKRSAGSSLRALRAAGYRPEDVLRIAGVAGC